MCENIIVINVIIKKQRLRGDFIVHVKAVYKNTNVLKIFRA